MKSLILLLVLLSGTLPTLAAKLTFRVDMRQQTVAATGVHVAGTFQSKAGFPADWDPATTALTDADGDKIYEVTVTVPAGTYRYKFINGNTWAGAELVPAGCGQDDGGGNLNRVVTVGSTDLRLPAIAFGDCATILRFAVNMKGQTVEKTGIHVAGNFQLLAGFGSNWDPAATPLSDSNGDGIYEGEVALPAPGRFEYKFINGNTWLGAEAVPAACGTSDGEGNLNRTVEAMAAVNSTGTLCFNSCESCGALPTEYTTHWWNDAVFYEVFVRSFYDSNGDGKGDFKGLTAKLDYLNDGNPATTTDLGITGIWLMPMMESPSYHGYDVTNYQATEPDYGTMAEFETFLAAAHARGIKVIIDLVLNHSSSQHPWFTASAGSASSSYRSWYRWSATNPGYTGPWGQTVWHPKNGSYYYGLFWDGMPDLNWSNPDVKAAMWDATRFWLNKKVDGYRLDAVKYLDEDDQQLEDTPETMALLQEFNGVVKEAQPDAFLVGEAWSATPKVAPYVINKRLDACFEFDLAGAIINGLNAGKASSISSQLQLVDQTYPRLQYATFLSNHDQERVLETLKNDLPRMKQAASLYLTMPGVPFLYYGEEVGMLGTGADENKRKPMQWTSGSNAGFSTGTPWRGLNGNYAQFNVATQAADPASLLNHYKQLIRLRNTEPTLRKGYLLPLSTTTNTDALLGYARVYEREATLVLANLSSASLANVVPTLTVSSLSPGTYTITNLLTTKAAGTLSIDTRGGIASWSTTLGPLAANQTWMLKLTPAQTPTAATSASKTLGLQVYPNPAARLVQLTFPAGPHELQVFDLNGRLLRTTTVRGPKYALSTADLANGTYFLRVQSGQGVAMQRLVVAH